MAANAATAIRHSKRRLMNSDTTMKNTISALTAFSVISAPQVELVNATLTADVSTPAASANAAVISADFSLGTSSIWTVTTSADSEVRRWMRAPAVSMPWSCNTCSASSMSKVSLAGTSQALPPSKSRPRLSPCTDNDATVMIRMTIAATNPTIRRP